VAEDIAVVAKLVSRRGTFICTSWAIIASTCRDGRLRTAHMHGAGTFIVADADDTEANAAALILRRKICHNVVDDCLCSSCDLGQELSFSKAIAQIQSESYGSAVVMLSRWFLHGPENVYLLITVLRRFDQLTLDLVPVSVTLFELPGTHFYTRLLPQCLAVATVDTIEMLISTSEDFPTQPSKVAIMLRTFFRVICVPFNTHGSDATITHQANEIFQRLRSGASVATHTKGSAMTAVRECQPEDGEVVGVDEARGAWQAAADAIKAAMAADLRASPARRDVCGEVGEEDEEQKNDTDEGELPNTPQPGINGWV